MTETVMNEFYVEVQDADGTAYVHNDITRNVVCYETLEAARFAAKSCLTDKYVVARVINAVTHEVSDFFEMRMK